MTPTIAEIFSDDKGRTEFRGGPSGTEGRKT